MREQVTLPPPGWRKPIPVLVKLDVVIRQEGKCKLTGEKLGKLKETQFHHDPAIHEREYVPDLDDTIPSCNDPDHIFAVKVRPHKVESAKGSKRMSKVTRLRDAERGHAEAMSAKAPGQPRARKNTIRSRGFERTHSRGFAGHTVRR